MAARIASVTRVLVAMGRGVAPALFRAAKDVCSRHPYRVYLFFALIWLLLALTVLAYTTPAASAQDGVQQWDGVEDEKYRSAETQEANRNISDAQQAYDAAEKEEEALDCTLCYEARELGEEMDAAEDEIYEYTDDLVAARTDAIEAAPVEGSDAQREAALEDKLAALDSVEAYRDEWVDETSSTYDAPADLRSRVEAELAEVETSADDNGGSGGSGEGASSNPNEGQGSGQGESDGASGNQPSRDSNEPSAPTGALFPSNLNPTSVAVVAGALALLGWMGMRKLRAAGGLGGVIRNAIGPPTVGGDSGGGNERSAKPTAKKPPGQKPRQNQPQQPPQQPQDSSSQTPPSETPPSETPPSTPSERTSEPPSETPRRKAPPRNKRPERPEEGKDSSPEELDKMFDFRRDDDEASDDDSGND